MGTDNGLSFNCGENLNLQRYFRWAGIKHRSTEFSDPEVNGPAEAMMNNIGNNRAMHRKTTRSSPTSYLTGRATRTRLPVPGVANCRSEMEKAARRRARKDSKHRAKDTKIREEEKVLFGQQRNKSQPHQDPDPYAALEKPCS